MSGQPPPAETPQAPPTGSQRPARDDRITPANLLKAVGIVLLIQVVALVVTKQNLPVYVGTVTGNLSGESTTSVGGAALNAILLVGLVFVLTASLVWLLRKKMVNSFKMIIFCSVSLSSFVLTLTTVDVFASNFLSPLSGLLAGVFTGALLVVLVGYTIFVKNRPWLSTAILAFVGAEVGSFFAETLPLYTALALAAAFSCYDIYAVFKGPLKQMIGTAPTVALVGMSIRAGEFTLGLGDIVFYTMLPSLAVFYVGYGASVATMLAIDAGVFVTLFLLSRKRLLPGLPIPMFLGLLALVAFRV